MKPTKRIEDYLKVNGFNVYFAVFSGVLKQTIYTGMADHLRSDLLPEEMDFLDHHIQQVGGDIATMMKDLQPRTGVTILKAGPHQGQQGVIVEITGPSNSRDKREILYRVEIEQQGQQESKLVVGYMAFEIERKQMPNGTSAPGWGSPGMPLTPSNRPRL